ncbi:hypothetical protein K435DRAFT_650087, partial [Dendrothele bispora CBS 962.96]
GDTFQLNFVNELDKNTMLKGISIIISYLFQPAFITQCPTSHGESFLYVFEHLELTGAARTYYRPSNYQLATQYCDGVRGPMVVYDPNGPHANLYDVDQDIYFFTASSILLCSQHVLIIILGD